VWSFRDADGGKWLARGAWNVVGQPVLIRLSLSIAVWVGARIAVGVGQRSGLGECVSLGRRCRITVCQRERRSSVAIVGDRDKLARRQHKWRGRDQQHLREQRSIGRHLVGQHGHRKPRDDV
jgi:hypothetical protein